MEQNFQNLIEVKANEIKASAKQGKDFCFMIGGTVNGTGPETINIKHTSLILGHMDKFVLALADVIKSQEDIRNALSIAFALAAVNGCSSLPIDECFVAEVKEALGSYNVVNENSAGESRL